MTSTFNLVCSNHHKSTAKHCTIEAPLGTTRIISDHKMFPLNPPSSSFHTSISAHIMSTSFPLPLPSHTTHNLSSKFTIVAPHRNLGNPLSTPFSSFHTSSFTSYPLILPK
uniref:Putative ovule protein n=1 Tax=Solanum chacoense TaxID=4108 RepID=A0A0V0HU98_SOLCH